tara:strand:- start:661 stop:1425 length:765 start_codon:yes stop_codon:yes gene_type:complete
MSELEEFLSESSESETTEVVEAPVEAAVEETKAVAEVDDSKGEDNAEPPSAEKTKQETGNVPIQALLDEREKRQAYEAQMRQMQSQLEKQNQQPAPTAPDVLDDQAGFANHLQQSVREEIQTSKIAQSQAMMRMMHEDYDSMESTFVQMARQNPQLVQEMNASPMPALYAYETAKKAEKFSQMQNIDEYQAKLKAEITEQVRAELKAEMEGKVQSDADLSNSITPSIANARAAGTNREAIAVPDPMSSGGIFDR